YTWQNAVKQVLANAKPRHVLRIARKRSISHHSREHVSTALEFSGGWLSCCCSHLLPLCYTTTNS
ncbi:unnamed protein product, partial [Staurois parvus]